MFEQSTSDAQQDDVHRCISGKDCRATVKVGEQELPALTEAVNTVCQPCTSSFARALSDMPETWVALHMAIGDQSRRVGQKVSGSRSAPINLNTDVDSLKTGIVEWLVAAAARVAETLNVDDPQPRNNTDTEQARTVVACTRLLTPHVLALLTSPADEITVWLGPSDTDYPGESIPNPNPDEPNPYKPNTGLMELTGMQIARRLTDLRGKARTLLALTNEKMALPCPLCNRRTLRRTSVLAYTSSTVETDEFDRVKCGECGKEWPYSHYQNLCEIWVMEDEMERDKLQKQLDVACHDREILAWLHAEKVHQFECALGCTDIPASVFAQSVLTYTLHDTESFMSDRDLAPIVGVSESTIRSWASQGLIGKHIAADGARVFHAQEVWNHAKSVRRTIAVAI